MIDLYKLPIALLMSALTAENADPVRRMAMHPNVSLQQYAA